jgi:hypothetical protein
MLGSATAVPLGEKLALTLPNVFNLPHEGTRSTHENEDFRLNMQPVCTSYRCYTHDVTVVAYSPGGRCDESFTVGLFHSHSNIGLSLSPFFTAPLCEGLKKISQTVGDPKTILNDNFKSSVPLIAFQSDRVRLVDPGFHHQFQYLAGQLGTRVISR